MPLTVSYVALSALLVVLALPGTTRADTPFTTVAQREESAQTETAQPSDQHKTESRLFEVLDEPTSLFSIESSLVDVLSGLSNKHRAPIILDKEWYEAEKPNVEVPISLDARGLKLREALDLMLPPVGMSFIIRDGAIQVTSLEKAQSYQYVRNYKLPSFAQGKETKVIDGIVATVSPKLWKQTSGKCSAVAEGGVLTINANRRVHTACMLTLEKMRRLHEIQSSNQPRLRGDITAPHEDPFSK